MLREGEREHCIVDMNSVVGEEWGEEWPGTPENRNKDMKQSELLVPTCGFAA